MEKMVAVFREVRRVLRDDGTLWLNLGDSYNSDRSRGTYGDQSSHGYEPHGSTKPLYPGLKPKDLIGMPWRLAFALQADGWWLRSAIVWAKPNPMPESVTDRPTKSYEFVFLMTKSATYYYDQEAVREPLQSDPDSWGRHSKKDPGEQAVNPRPMFGPARGDRDGTDWGNGKSRNLRDVWTIPTAPYPEAHFATFPPALCLNPIKAGTSEKGCCSECGAPWVRIVEKKPSTMNIATRDAKKGILHLKSGFDMATPKNLEDYGKEEMGCIKTLGWRPSCECDAGDPIPCTVLDPFAGAGTVGLVADQLGRDAILIELKEEYALMAEKRIKDDSPMFADVRVKRGAGATDGKGGGRDAER